jgi:hypothetical protein
LRSSHLADETAVERARTRSLAEEATLTDSKGLTRDEDDELRRLHYFTEVGNLSDRKQERLIELRLRDRRKTVRQPREFGEDESYATPRRRRWLPFGGQ